MKSVGTIFSIYFLHGHASSNAFTLSPFSQSYQSHRTVHSTNIRLSSSPSSSSSSDVFVLSYDGVVANTNQWRSNLAINAALRTWPDLSNHSALGDNGKEDRAWLVNKISALLSVTLDGEDGMIGCDAVLLARLLLEEQLLDEGRSNGCRGKYGSKFHPTTNVENGTTSQSGSKQGSRPLTVGEISANWNDGASLKDTLRIKYNVDRKDPIPIIKDQINACLEENNEGPLPELYPSICEALIDCGSPVYVLVGGQSHVPTALSSLSQLSVPVDSMDWDRENEPNTKSGITIVPPGEGGRGHEGILQYILMSAPKESSVHVVHSDVSMLQRAKTLFGDNRPRAGCFEKSGVADVMLKLSLPSMSSGPQQQNDAEMDPWLNVVDEFELVETLSARIAT